MTKEELQAHLYQIEEYEKKDWMAWLTYQKRHQMPVPDYQWLPETARPEEEKLIEEYKKETWQQGEYILEKSGMPKPIILEYQMRDTGEWGTSPVEAKNPSTRLLSRDLLADKSGMGGWLMIQKHSRFSYCLPHTHSFLEMNYCYHGHCTNIVDGKVYEMEAGDMLLMEPGCEHQIGIFSGEDILMNFIWFPSGLLQILDKILPGDCDLARFLIRALYRLSGRANYIFIHAGVEPRIVENINEILQEYFDPGQVAQEEMVSYLVQELFARLWRLEKKQPESIFYRYQPNSAVANLIFYIREHYLDCTREEVAEKFGYSGSRISNLLTENIGKSFVELRNEFRLEQAEELLRSTTLPVQEIAQNCGFSNQTYFYRLYRKHFGRLPRESFASRIR